MAAIFSPILNMSMTGSIVILLVLLVRIFLKRSPRVFSYALWSVVLFRLLCPVAFTAPVSILNFLEPEQREASNNTSIMSYIPATVEMQADFIMVQRDERPTLAATASEPDTQLIMTPMHAAALVWASGTLGMMLYSFLQYLALRRKLVGSIQQQGNIYLADHIDTAFVVGLVQPRIYLPSAVPEKERYYILAHEQHHIRRGDHIIKLLAYFALCIHWFNPLVWIAFVLASKDMEMSCDEAVIKKLGAEIRADYSMSLLRLTTHRKIIAGMPLAFGEGDAKVRVMNIARWKKPKMWVSIVCGLLCVVVLVSCALNPDKADDDERAVFGECVLGAGSEELTQSDYTKYLQDAYGLTALEDHRVYHENGIFQMDFRFSEDAEDWQLESAEQFAINKFYVRDAAQYDLWKYDTWLIEHRSETTKQVQYRIFVGNALTDQGVYDGVHTDLVQYGALRAQLPSGMEATDENGILALTIDSDTVGGIALRKQSQTNSSDIFSAEWMVAIGVPEASDTDMGYMSSGSQYADYEITYFPDLPVNYDENGNIIRDAQGTYVLEHEVTHYFFVQGIDVYDVWFYNNRISNSMQEGMLKTCVLEGITEIATMQSTLSEEREALQQCRSVLEQIQSSNGCKVETKQENGAFALNETSSSTTWIHGDNRLNFSRIPESGGASIIGRLLVDGTKYECGSAKEWREITWWDLNDPWLVSFRWDKSVVAYMDTLEEESGITVMLRIDQPFAEGEDQQPHYFVNFCYDADGIFRNVHVQTNLFMPNAVSMTETIASLDGELVNAEIRKEYQNAIG